MKWNLNKNSSFGLGVALFVLIAIGITSYYSLNRFRAIRKSENKTREILVKLDAINASFKDLEISLYIYILSSNDSNLQSYRLASGAVIKDIAWLTEGLAENKQAVLLQDLLTDKFKAATRLIQVRNSMGQQAAIEKVQAGMYKAATNEISNLIHTIKKGEEANVSSQHSKAADTNLNYTLLFILFGNLMALSCFVGAIFFLNRNIGKRKQAHTVLNNFIQKTAETKKQEDQFLANISHEIRTPMNAIIGMTNLILKTPLEPKVQSYLKAISQSSDNLMVIINEILDFSKITAGKIEFEKVNFNLSDIFYGLYNTFKIRADEKGLKLTPIIDEDLPDIIVGDPGKLNQVLVNLIGNSIKFTNKGKIDILCKLIERSGYDLLIEFSVRDTGIGIPKGKIAAIFEDFTQASTDTSRKFGGTGLGLSISKKIVELQKGTIKVESVLGEGTTFSFILPFKVGTEKIERKEQTSKVKAQELHGLNILLVEDNEFNQVVAVDTLNTLIKNLTIHVAENGRIALEKLKENNFYNIILMDVQMPEMNGYQTTQHIRKDTTLGYTDIPIIAMTASATEHEIEKCFESGMSDFISKPIDAEILLIKIASQINKDKKEIRQKTIKSDPDAIAKEALKESITNAIANAGKVIPPAKASIVDLSFLKNMTSNNAFQMLKYINMFLESVPSDWLRLKEKAEEKSWQEVRSIAHSMKPRITYMGIKEGAEIIKQIEHNAAEEINLQFMPELIVKFENILYITYKELELEKQAF